MLLKVVNRVSALEKPAELLGMKHKTTIVCTCYGYTKGLIQLVKRYDIYRTVR
jgi:hypothetical protein